MKKILFASTALVAASMMHAGAAEAADKIKLNVGGYSKWWVVGVWQSDKFQNISNVGGPLNNNVLAGTQGIGASTNGSGQRANFDVKGDNEIWFSGSTKLDNGLGVGVFVSLEAGGHSDLTTDVIDASYAWIEGGFGKVIAGTAPNGTALTHVQAPDAANGTIGGSMLGLNFAVAKPTSVMGMNQIVGYSGSTNTTAFIADDKAEKITYVAPSFYGLTLGASYIPNVMRQDVRTTPLSRAEAWGGTALYANTFGPVGVKASAGYIWVDISASGAVGERAMTSQVYGAQISYAGFTLGGSTQVTRDDHRSSALTNTLLSATGDTRAGLVSLSATKNSQQLDFGGVAYDVSLMYASGPYAVSVGYFRSEVNGIANVSTTAANSNNGRGDVIEFYQASGKYNLGPGVDALATVGYADYKDQRKGTMGTIDAAYENSGWAAMTGLSLTF
ncbi:porin [Paramagnetospirillum kuznetsovii]|uniref:Porin n=1 Tax=Paramagnetospirillum kuznetsovii TaxID=2053833 RepID=A0A364P2F8_9PROT|nr:porin [Paramagnetospirillum kuznetsovii]RAU23539.1 porin [Paramagnetospirillum kuznetsovii]